MAPPPPVVISSLSLSLSLPPRTSPATPTSARPIRSHGLTSSKTACLGIGTSPRVGKHAQFVRRQPEVRVASAVAAATDSPSTSPTSPMRPKRPLSASRVPSPTSASKAAGHSFSPRVRPVSASHARSAPLDRSVNDVDTIPIAISDVGVHHQDFFPTIRDLGDGSDHDTAPYPASARDTSAPKTIAGLPVTTDPVTAHAKFQAFLEMWENEQIHFRSSVLFSETTFAQAKAMVSDWPRPNVLLSAVALGSLEQLGHSLEKQYPFLLGLVHEVGAAMYANFDQLGKLQDGGGIKKNRFLVYFQHGRLWFQALAGEQQLNHSLRASDTTQRDEIERLMDALQEQKAAHLVEKMQDRVKRAVRSREATREDHRVSELEAEAACHSVLPLLARLLLHGDDESADDTLSTRDGSFQEFVREMTRVFSSLNDGHALKLLRALLDSANSDREHKPLAELLAIAVDALDEPARRAFLREYFAFVANDELQDALRERDESNDTKRLASFVGELFDSLGLDPSTSIRSGSTTFHSDQARVIKSVLDRTELLQEIAAEFCFLDDDTSARALTEDLRQRLRAFETPARRILKAQQLMASSSSAASASSTSKEAFATCTCTCGNHRLVGVDEQAEDEDDKANRSSSDRDDVNSDNEAKQRRKSRRRSSVGARRRKNGINFGSQLASSAYGKRASASLRIFPLSEVCRLLTSILHLQFSRDAVDEDSAYSSLKRAEDGGVSMLSMDDDRWAFLRRSPKPNFKTLARDFLTRKYGIKSIAIMHSLQLERSLAHYAALLNHTRCNLFAWFFGADRSPSRLASRDYAFRFFQRLVKALIRLLASKKPQSVSSSTFSVVNGSVSVGVSPLSPLQTALATSNPSRPSAPLAYSALVSIWTESIGDGESSSPSSVDAKSLPSAVAIETCRLVFPRSFQDDHPAFGALLERFYRVGLEKKPVELEGFLRRVMDAWQTAFEAFASKISESIQQVTRLDFDGLGQCLAANGLELTGGERLELFDLLASDGDAFGNGNDEDDGGGGGAVVAAKKRVLHFLLEAKYLLPVT